jgi:hypothetical protein
MQNQMIAELSDLEIAEVSGGTVLVGRVFYWAGVVQTAEWVIENAYEAGKWVGEHS